MRTSKRAFNIDFLNFGDAFYTNEVKLELKLELT